MCGSHILASFSSLWAALICTAVIRCAYQRIVNIMTLYIERNNMQGELIRFRKNSEFIDVGNFEVGIYFSD